MHENDMKVIDNAKNGNKDAMTKLIEDNNGLIWSIVRRFNGRGYDIEDLYQIGTIGFIKAIQRFDTSFEVRLSTYAVPYILGEIKRYIRDDGTIKISRSIKEIQVKIKQLQEDYRKKNKEEISIEEISKKLSLDKEDIVVALEASKPIESIDNVYKTEKGEKGISLIDKVASEKDEQEMLTNKIAIREIIKDLPKEDKEIIMLRYYKQKTQKEVASIVGVSQVQVSRTERKILQKMKRALTGVC